MPGGRQQRQCFAFRGLLSLIVSFGVIGVDELVRPRQAVCQAFLHAGCCVNVSSKPEAEDESRHDSQTSRLPYSKRAGAQTVIATICPKVHEGVD